MLELIIGIIIGAAFADFWKSLYHQAVKVTKDFIDKARTD